MLSSKLSHEQEQGNLLNLDNEQYTLSVALFQTKIHASLFQSANQLKLMNKADCIQQHAATNTVCSHGATIQKQNAHPREEILTPVWDH